MILRDRVALRLPRIGLAMIGLLATSTLPAWSQRAATENNASGERLLAGSRDTGAQNTGVVFDISADALPQEAGDLIAQYEKLKADAQREMEDRMSRARSELTRQLKTLQDRYARAGKLDEAVAIRDRLRAMEPSNIGGSPANSGLPVMTTAPIAPDGQPANLTMFRDRVGQTLTLHVVGSTDGIVWGKDVYTDDSSVGAAAVHAGILRPGEAGDVRVTILPGRSHYDSASQNGVESRSYDAWPGSYRFAGGPIPDQPSFDKLIRRLPARENPGTLESLSDQVGQTFTFLVTGATDGPIWGGAENVYTVDSNLATAAVHAGVLKAGERGVVTVKILPDRGSYDGTMQNGVESRSWGAWHGSYRVSAGESRARLDRPTPPRTY